MNLYVIKSADSHHNIGIAADATKDQITRHGTMERVDKPIEKRTELAVRYLLGEHNAKGKIVIKKI